MSSMPMHVMTIVAALALLTVAFVMSYKKKSKSEEDYQAKRPTTKPTTPPRPIYVDKDAIYNPNSRQWVSRGVQGQVS